MNLAGRLLAERATKTWVGILSITSISIGCRLQIMLFSVSLSNRSCQSVGKVSSARLTENFFKLIRQTSPNWSLPAFVRHWLLRVRGIFWRAFTTQAFMNSRKIGSCDSKLRILQPMENIGFIWRKTMGKLHCPFHLFLNWSQKKTVPITKLFTIHLLHFGYLMDRSWRTFHFPKNKLDESHP